MKLSDFVQDPESIHRLMHLRVPTPQERDARISALQPFALAFRKCIMECGPCTHDPQAELDVMYTTLCIIDTYLEEVTKENN